MIRGVVTFGLRVTRLEGAAKLSHNKGRVEQERIAEVLLMSDDPDVAATGTDMRQRLAALGER